MPNDQLALFAYDTRREQARALRRAGATIREIKAQLGTGSNRKVQEWLDGVPVPSANRRPRAKDLEGESARAMRRQGMTYTEIAAALRVSKSSCSRWCEDLPRPPVAVGR